MTSILLVIIYLSFISLGLPDGLLGSAWPAMHAEIGASSTAAGTVAMIISCGTIVSSLNADRLIHRFGAGKVTFASVALTAFALFAFSWCRSYLQLCIFALPYGLGAGAVDSALNNYVALHYKSRHMSWLHCFWGVGAAIGPYIMGYALAGGSWRSGYSTVGLLQSALTLILLFSLPLWRRADAAEQEEAHNVLSLKEAVSLPHAKALLGAFFLYCGIETSSGLWASSYLVQARGMDTVTAASWASLFYIGITAGRFVCGFITEKLGDRRMILLGNLIIAAGALVLFLPVSHITALIGLIMIGLGCAPIYPSIIHSTPDRFGKENSQSLIGVQMACAYAGSLVMPKLIGVILGAVSFAVYPVLLEAMAVLFFFVMRMAEKKNS